MVIKSGKNFIQIINTPILTQNLIVEFIKSISQEFSISKSVDELTNVIILTENEKESYKNFYFRELNAKYSFEEFMSIETLTHSNFSIYSKNGNVLIGKVDFWPDGDVDCIWIDVIDRKYMGNLLQAISACTKRLTNRIT